MGEAGQPGFPVGVAVPGGAVCFMFRSH
jgi:hypothetical protein